MSAAFLAAVLCGGSLVWAAPGDSFSFAVIADTHLETADPNSDSYRRLQASVDWINRNRRQQGIDLVMVLGDIGYVDNGRAVVAAKGILDGLAVPYVPLSGDNDTVTVADEVAFAATFEPVYQSLAANPMFSNWQKAPAPVWNPGEEAWVSLQNFTFDYRGVHFVCADWCDRTTRTSSVRAEDADLHDFPGGTFPWFTETIGACSRDKLENILMFSHDPMHTLAGWLEFLAGYAGFAPAEFAQIDAFLRDPNHDTMSYVAQAFGGHYHFDTFLPADLDPNRIQVGGFGIDPNTQSLDMFVPLPGYDLSIIGATYLDPSPIGLVRVTEGQTSFSYQTTFLTVPEPSVAFLLLAGSLVGGSRRGRRA